MPASCSRAQDAEGFPPNRQHLGTEHIRYGVKDQVKTSIAKHRQVTHITLDGDQHQILPPGNHAVLFQLPGGIIEDSNNPTRSGKYGSLLTTSRRQAQDVKPMQVFREPAARD